MHGVNLDLLSATAAHHPDGRPKDPHAHHRADVLDLARAAQHARWRASLHRVRALLIAIASGLRLRAKPL